MSLFDPKASLTHSFGNLEFLSQTLKYTTGHKALSSYEVIYLLTPLFESRESLNSTFISNIPERNLRLWGSFESLFYRL